MDFTIDLLVSAIPSTSLAGVLIYLLKNPDKAEKWSSILARLFSRFNDAAERRSVSSDIQADINAFARITNGKVDVDVSQVEVQYV